MYINLAIGVVSHIYYQKAKKVLTQNKPLVWSLLFLVVYSTTIVFAAPPTSPYTPQDNITNPTCAPTDTNCFVSLFPDQASNAGKLLFTDGTTTAWSDGLTWDGSGTLALEASSNQIVLNRASTSAASHIAFLTNNSVNWAIGTIYNGGSPNSNFSIGPSVSSYTASYFTIDTSGNTGIGTNVPGEKLEVVGNIVSKGTVWTPRTSAADNLWDSVVYGNGMFVAVGESGTGNRVMTSPDGINWTTRTSAADQRWLSVTYGNGLFVAVSPAGGDNIMTSPDGINWTLSTDTNATSDKDWRAVTYGNGTFVAVGSKGTGTDVATSTDGVTWTLRTTAASNAWQTVTYGNGLFVALSNTGTGNRVMTSPDGITWTSRTSAADNTWSSVTYGNGTFVAVGRSGTGNRVMTSPDGITWTSRANPVDNDWSSVTYGNGLFVAVAFSGTGNRVMTSPDGITWTTRTSVADNDWNGVTYGNGMFVAVSSSGIGNRVMTSGKTDYVPFSANNIFQGGASVFGRLGVGTSSPGGSLDVQGGKVNIGGSYVPGTSQDFFTFDVNPTLNAGANNQRLAAVRLRQRTGNDNGFTGILRPNLIVENAGGGEFPFQLFEQGVRIGAYSGGSVAAITAPNANLELKGFFSNNSTYTIRATNLANTEIFSVRNDVRVGVANASPALTFHAGNSTISGAIARFENTTGTCDINPTTTSLSCSSDINLKKNITSLDSSLSLITNLRPVTYNWNTQYDTDTKIPGFIAQEVESQIPFLVTTDPATNLKSLNYTLFTPYIVKAIQELDMKIAPLEETIGNNGTLMQKFFTDVVSSVENGIAYIKSIRSDRVETKELCTTNGICLNETDIERLYQMSHGTSGGGTVLLPEGESSEEQVITEESADTPEEEEVDEPQIDNDQSEPVADSTESSSASQ